MNASQDTQTSGNKWTGIPADLLNQVARGLLTDQWTGSERNQLWFDASDREMARHRAEHIGAMADVRRNYVLPLRETSVVRFLDDHRSISQLLLEAISHLKECFGANAIFSLRTVADEAGSRTLYVVVLWSGSVGIVREGLSRFDDAWWLAHSRNAAGHLVFTYELV